MKFGLSEARTWISATNDRRPWFIAGASHMNQAITTKYLTDMSLVSLHQKLRQFSC